MVNVVALVSQERSHVSIKVTFFHLLQANNLPKIIKSYLRGHCNVRLKVGNKHIDFEQNLLKSYLAYTRVGVPTADKKDKGSHKTEFIRGAK